MNVVLPDSAESAFLREVDPTRVAAHPANPRTDLGDLAELQESIRAQGIVQPPILLPAERVAGAYPQYAERLASAELVVLVGHRRHAACLALANEEGGATSMPAVVRVDAIADDALAQLDAMCAENIARKALSPSEEARAFAEQVAAGRSQRAIAARVGCAQSHVSKRLKLLALPPEMLAQVDAGELDVGRALEFVAAAPDEPDVMLAAYELGRERTWWSPEQVVREVRLERARQAEAEALAKKAEAEGLRLIDNPAKEVGPQYWEQRLVGQKAIARARREGTLVAHIRPQGGGLDYYSTTPPKRTENRSPAEENRIRDQRERRLAMTARAEHAAILAARAPKVAQAAEDIVDACLWAPGHEVCSLAIQWLTAAGVGPDPSLPVHEWWEQIRRADWSTKVHAAHAVAIARREIQTRQTYRIWTREDAAWLDRLVRETGYRPTEWEQERLANLDAESAARRGEYRLVHDASECEWRLLDGDGVRARHGGIGGDDHELAMEWASDELDHLLAVYGSDALEWTPLDEAEGLRGYLLRPPGRRGEGEQEVDEEDARVQAAARALIHSPVSPEVGLDER